VKAQRGKVDDPEAIVFKRLLWDTERLGVTCGLIDCSLCNDKMDQGRVLACVTGLMEENRDIEFATIKLPPAFRGVLNGLIKEGAAFIDTELIFRFQKSEEREKAHEIAFLDTFEPDIFLPLAGEMTWSRFFMDERIPAERAHSLWTHSIRSQCLERADALAVAFRDVEPAGLVTLHFEEAQKIRLFIVGVLPECQGCGVGSDLMKAVTEKYGAGYDIYVETSSMNRTAQRLYQKAGFGLSHMRYLLHKMQ